MAQGLRGQAMIESAALQLDPAVFGFLAASLILLAVLVVLAFLCGLFVFLGSPSLFGRLLLMPYWRLEERLRQRRAVKAMVRRLKEAG